MYHSFAFGLLIVAGTFTTTHAVKCYECTNCTTVNANTKMSTTACVQCSKIQTYANNKVTNIDRECLSDKTCVASEPKDGVGLKKTCCEMDLCNSGFIHQPIWSVLIISICTMLLRC
ncbi:Secreted Ly-6/uPAR protein 1 [Paragonimus heterotremus]|uniref:Secreted Ly-6/uPAR protein 1 n=1 Tax=Paragonimus heterotremus TaxID=100268 RepID=A0A8J4WHA5_9TREM|nr:Secreted Ly-6/uPAR protein 1 [Paragonimus heterotremus]